MQAMLMMEQSQLSKTTHKAIVSRQRILDTALGLFATKGYEKTTMREIAAEAECSLGLTYRYFASKEELVLELYLKLVLQLEELAGQLASGSIADRFQRIFLAQLELMLPYRETLSAIYGPALNPYATTGVFGESAPDVRRQSRDVYIRIVSGSRDAPRGAQVEEMATVLYGMQLALTLFWLQDLSPDTQKTYEFVAFLHDMLAIIRPLMRLPVVSHALARLTRIIGPMLGAAQVV
jgi:AcrR family transcriptional regulator